MVESDKKASPPAFYGILAEITKFTLVVVFILYAIGFIIWHSYLAEYGVSSVEFLQTEYLSAALCYVFLFAVLGVPPALISAIWIENKKTGLTGQRRSQITVICIAWLIGLVRIADLYFPGELTPAGQHFLFILGSVALVFNTHVSDVSTATVAAVSLQSERVVA